MTALTVTRPVMKKCASFSIVPGQAFGSRHANNLFPSVDSMNARVRTAATGTLGVDRVRLEEEYDGETDETARRLRLRMTETEDEKVPPRTGARYGSLGSVWRRRRASEYGEDPLARPRCRTALSGFGLTSNERTRGGNVRRRGGGKSGLQLPGLSNVQMRGRAASSAAAVCGASGKMASAGGSNGFAGHTRGGSECRQLVIDVHIARFVLATQYNVWSNAT